MKNKKKYLTIFCSLIVSLSLQSQNDIIISEIMYNTPLNKVVGNTQSYGSGECIELYNVGINKVDLTGWKLRVKKNEKITFRANTVIPPKSYILIIHQYSNSDITDQLSVADLCDRYRYEYPMRQLYYQEESILSDLGEVIILTDETGFVKDSLFYEWGLNKKKSNNFSADTESTANAMSLQRTNVNFDENGDVIPSNSDWAVSPASPFSMHPDFVNAIESTSSNNRVVFSYDVVGNRRSKSIVLSKIVKSKSNNENNAIDDEQDEIYFDNISKKTIVIYPNPTKGQLAVEIKEFSEGNKGNITVYNSGGKVIGNQTIVSGVTDFNLSSNAPGIYIMRINLDGESSTWKIIKE